MDTRKSCPFNALGHNYHLTTDSHGTWCICNNDRSKIPRKGKLLSSNKSANEVTDSRFKGRILYTLPNSDRLCSLEIILLSGCCSHTKNHVPVGAALQKPLLPKRKCGNRDWLFSKTSWHSSYTRKLIVSCLLACMWLVPFSNEFN